MNEFIYCPCCKKKLSMNVYQFGEHYQKCLKAYDDFIKQSDQANQARIELNAAVEKFNTTMKDIGLTETASVLFKQTTSTKGDFWDDMFDFITNPC